MARFNLPALKEQANVGNLSKDRLIGGRGFHRPVTAVGLSRVAGSSTAVSCLDLAWVLIDVVSGGPSPGFQPRGGARGLAAGTVPTLKSSQMVDITEGAAAIYVSDYASNQHVVPLEPTVSRQLPTGAEPPVLRTALCALRDLFWLLRCALVTITKRSECKQKQRTAGAWQVKSVGLQVGDLRPLFCLV